MEPIPIALSLFLWNRENALTNTHTETGKNCEDPSGIPEYDLANSVSLIAPQYP